MTTPSSTSAASSAGQCTFTDYLDVTVDISRLTVKYQRYILDFKGKEEQVSLRCVDMVNPGSVPVFGN